MKLHTLPLSVAAEVVDGLVRQLLGHPEATDQDRPVLANASAGLSEVKRLHLPRFTPVDPATLPPRQPGQAYPVLPKGWAVDWEEGKEGGHA